MRYILALLAASFAWGQTTETVITDTVRIPVSGGLLNGKVVVTPSHRMTCGANSYALVPVTVQIVNGALSLSLVPNSACTPVDSSGNQATYYTAKFSDTAWGGGWTETWIVPVSVTAVTIASVQAAVPAAATSTIALAQITQSGAATSQVPKWSGSAWVPGYASELATVGWGAITGSISSQTDLNSALGAKEATANKGAASGYASLDSGTKVPYAQLPTGTTAGTVAAGDDSRFSTAGVSSVNGVTGAVTLAAGTSGTAPAWSGGTLNLPLAATTSVTAGLISKTQYDTFNAKEPAITATTSADYYRGDKTMQTLDKTAVGLGNVENTAVSTWTGSTNITTLGTIATGSVPWARLTGVPEFATGSTSVVLASNYAFDAQAPGGTLTGSVGATVTLTPCPLGVAGTATGHYLWVSGGTGTAEAVLITGGTCTSGLASGTVTFTPANSHSGAWTVGPASGGIQEAINASPAWGIVQVVAPPDEQYAYEIKAKVTIAKNITVEGSSTYNTVNIFRSTSYPSGDLFYGAAGTYDIQFRNHNILANATGHATGAAFNFTTGNSITMTDVVIGNGYKGIILDGTGGARLTRVIYVNVDVSFQQGYGIQVTGGSVNTWITDSQFYGYPTTDADVLYAGIYIDNCDGLWVNNSMFYGSFGIKFSLESATGAIYNVQFTGCQVDNVRNAAVDFYGSAKVAKDIKFVGCHLHSQGGNGGAAITPAFAIGYGAAATVDSLQVVGCNIQGSNVHGVYIRAPGAKHILFDGNRITGNNVSNTATQGGIYVYTAQSGLTLTNNTIGNDAGGYQDYGILLLTSISDSVITGNKLTNNDTGGMLSSTPPTSYSNVTIENNLGVSDVVPSVAAAATVALPFNPVVKITGTVAAIATLNGGWAGRKVRLLFTDASPDGVTTGGNILRAQSAVQYQVIELTFDGTNWY